MTAYSVADLSKSQVGGNETTGHTKNKGCRSDRTDFSSVACFASYEVLLQQCRRDMNDTQVF